MTADRLMDFQRATVDYVLRRLYDDPDPTSRFLVADEVGMGKTLVARGVIAGAIERLEHDDTVDRIDIVYICSNADIARQNIVKLDVVGDGTRPLSTRITMLATQIKDLDRPCVDGRKVVNLIAFTPGTSFSRGHSSGRVTERALLAYLLEPLLHADRRTVNALHRVLKVDVSEERWKGELHALHEAPEPPDPGITECFRQRLAGSPLLGRLEELVQTALGRPLPTELRQRRAALIRDLRHELARVSISALEPDLVILDEFQRFKHLLEHPDQGAESEVSQLAHDLFTYENVKVLLLSATPYKPLTLAEEEELTGDNHYKDLLATIRFLAHPDGEAVEASVRDALATYRSRLVSGGDSVSAKTELERLLRAYMSRTERPTLGEANLLAERTGDVLPPHADELLDFVALRRLSGLVEAPLHVDYWKSAPYFLNFMDGYILSTRVRAQLDDPEVRAALLNVHAIQRSDVDSNADIPPRNARLRALGTDTIGADLWKLLWLPPSMPYYSPAGVYRSVDLASTTKRLIFSSWAAAPSAIAALLSHAAHHRMLGGAREHAARLNYSVDGHRPDGMTTLALTAPVPPLARLADPLAVARSDPDQVLDAEEVLSGIARSVYPRLGASPRAVQGLQSGTWHWAAPLSMATYDFTELHKVMGSNRGAEGLRQHLERANDAVAGRVPLSSHPTDLPRVLALFGAAAPGNCAWRSLQRLVGSEPGISSRTVVLAAARIGEAFRSLFNRAEVMGLLDALYGDGAPYWQHVLEYCFAGNLQAVLDEYLHHLVGYERPRSDSELMDLAETVAVAVSFRGGRVQAFDPSDPDHPIHFTPRFAVRYGNARGATRADEEGTERLADVRAAFNSPFWPMVLASTSVGQEGIDFHWWCHSLVHWNQPANVVDLEQREGRIHRFRGHAIRKNVAAAHRANALRSTDPDPWAAAFEAAREDRPPDSNDLWPSWVFPGPAKVRCWVPYYPLSQEIERSQRMRRDRALYRLAFGQPRQEDLIELLEAQGLAADEQRLRELRIDLRPPSLPSR